MTLAGNFGFLEHSSPPRLIVVEIDEGLGSRPFLLLLTTVNEISCKSTQKKQLTMTAPFFRAYSYRLLH